MVLRPQFSGYLAHGTQALLGCTSQGVPERVTQGGGPGARGCDRRPGGCPCSRPALPPCAPATPREMSRRLDSLPLRSPDSPSSLPTGWAPDTASQRRRALSRSKRSPSGSRPSRSSELLYGRAPPLSAASTVPNPRYSIFPASPNRPIVAHKPWSREMWDVARPTNLARFGLCGPPCGTGPTRLYLVAAGGSRSLCCGIESQSLV